MKIEQLIRRTSAKRRSLAQFVKIKKVRRGRINGIPFIAAQTESEFDLQGGNMVYIPPARRATYVTEIHVLDNKFNVRVSCSCPDFMYREEVALAYKGAAEVRYSNGELPIETNPKMVPYVCKHICALHQKIAHLLR